MARIPHQRQRPWAIWCAVLIVCILHEQGQARFLVKQNVESLGPSEVSSSATETTAEKSQTEATPFLGVGPDNISPFYWFQQQLAVFAALERAMKQHLHEGMVPNDAARSLSPQEDLLRHVGCARMRAALLNKVAQQGSEILSGTSVSDLSAGTTSSSSGSTTGRSSTSSSSITNVMTDNGEVYEKGSVSSRVAYTGSRDSSRLRGEGENAEGVAAGDSGDKAVTGGFRKSRALQGAVYSDSSLEPGMMVYEFYDYGFQGYGSEYGEEYEDGGEEEEEWNGEEDEEPMPDTQARKRQDHDSALLKQYNLEGRLLKLLGGAHTLTFGGGDNEHLQSQASRERFTDIATKDVNGLAATAAALTTTAVDADTSEQTISTVAGKTMAGGFMYDSNVLDKSDMMFDFGSYDTDADQYEHEIYDDYYQAISLADTMLSRLDLDSDKDAWADYLEQAYEFFAYDNDIDWYKLDGMYDPSIWDAPNALAALANIAELVLWAHTGDIVLEVRPGFTTSHFLEENGAIVDSNSVFLVARNPYSDDGDIGYTATIYGHVPDEVGSGQLLLAEPQQQAPLEFVNVMSMQLVFPDGSVNWGLVTMLILIAGTLAMLVGFVASYISLRRSMALLSHALVYVPPRLAGKQQGCSGWGNCGGWPDLSGKGGKAVQLLLHPDDIQGAVCWMSTPVRASTVEDASQYVSTKVENESVAKALHK
ncbi:hypothetical protein Vretimale_4170 [Volvox reticuliferus]|uniref:Uncharacterized protein n=1 Tax=Volvox reticuliferus TaxID=1737510 RepID=A0A8J4C3G6_9CHLO|nr:hypothetical protein Vretifemale_2836 [Volvox reticuliferus]GIL98971.1 hypothetical protein Vretimale_4170 [Volvox reticuliferus]